MLNAVRHKEEAQIVAGAGQGGQITIATNMAGRGTDIKLGRGVAELGGLHVIAAERNESGRIDRQLYGRCARQGDPGSSQAIVSCEDELVTRHAGPLAAGLRARYAGRTDDVASPLTRSLFGLAQFLAQRAAYRQRRAVTRADHWLDENLSFAGTDDPGRTTQDRGPKSGIALAGGRPYPGARLITHFASMDPRCVRRCRRC